MSCGSRRTLVYTHRYANAKERESPGNSLSLPPVCTVCIWRRGVVIHLRLPSPPPRPPPHTAPCCGSCQHVYVRVLCVAPPATMSWQRDINNQVSPAVYVGTISIRPSIRVYPVVPSTWRSSLVAESPSMCPSPHLAPHNPAPPGQVLPASPTPPVYLFLQIVHPLRCTLSTVSWPPSSSSACPHRRRNP